ncbi:MAG: tannase/feruloyl esterase family alpha/beta hydrolase [Chloroflexi bacterium]|nr:tannase/feruloyl esterase family alpha/beta hydrolase [Chloroflexota bacterium]
MSRLFLAPGVTHCGLFGPVASDPLDQLVQRLELGKAPTSLDGVATDPNTGAVSGMRPICEYPSSARYIGHGSITDASSFPCPR